MIDKKLYQETFSRLRASEQAKQEVFKRMENNKTPKRRISRAFRATAIAAVMAVALGVTALASDGTIFRIIWTDGNQFMAEDGQGNQVFVTTTEPEAGMDVTCDEEGRIIVHADRDIDITDQLRETGSYQYSYAVAVQGETGEETKTVTIDVTGTPENWTATSTDGSGVATTITGGTEEEPVDVDAVTHSRPAVVVEGDKVTVYEELLPENEQVQ